MIAAALAILAALAVGGYLKHPPAVAEPVRFEVFPPGKGNFNSVDSPVAVYPDGRQLVFGVTDERGDSFLWVRSLGSLEVRRLEGTDSCYDPVWSADGRNIAFGCRSHLQRRRRGRRSRRVDLRNERRPGRKLGVTTNVILFTTAGGMSPILRIPANGGTPQPVTVAGQVSWRERATGGRGFSRTGNTFYSSFGARSFRTPGWLSDRSTSREIVRLSGINSAASWAPPGMLLFVRDRDPLPNRSTWAACGSPATPSSSPGNVDYAQTWAAPAFSASDNGVLAYQSGGRAIRRLAWFDRSGKDLGALWGSRRVPASSPHLPGRPTSPECARGPRFPKHRHLDSRCRGVGSRQTVRSRARGIPRLVARRKQPHLRLESRWSG